MSVCVVMASSDAAKRVLRSDVRTGVGRHALRRRKPRGWTPRGSLRVGASRTPCDAPNVRTATGRHRFVRVKRPSAGGFAARIAGAARPPRLRHLTRVTSRGRAGSYVPASAGTPPHDESSRRGGGGRAPRVNPGPRTPARRSHRHRLAQVPRFDPVPVKGGRSGIAVVPFGPWLRPLTRAATGTQSTRSATHDDASVRQSQWSSQQPHDMHAR